jgi:hypothetical protein
MQEVQALRKYDVCGIKLTGLGKTLTVSVKFEML